jgi:hypothetical protein
VSQVSTDLAEARAAYGHALAEALLIKGSTAKPAKAVIDRVVARLLDAQSDVLHLEAEAGTDGAI